MRTSSAPRLAGSRSARAGSAGPDRSMGGVELTMTDHQHSQGPPPKARGVIPGLIKGLATTARTLARPTHTAEYPDAQPHLPPRTRGVIALLEENCTSCMLCARECPDWCIYIDSHKETLPATTEGGAGAPAQRARPLRDRLLAVHVLRHLHRGLPVRRPALESRVRVRRVRHPGPAAREGRLGQWMPTVPPPPALDPNSAEPQEITAANKPARTAPTGSV